MINVVQCKERSWYYHIPNLIMLNKKLDDYKNVYEDRAID